MSSRETSHSSPGDGIKDTNKLEGDTSAAEAALQARLSRKRTKTGCLTCRKRRIKCGEERPSCKNCIKSRRYCEGYIPSYKFRPPPDHGQSPHHIASFIGSMPSSTMYHFPPPSTAAVLPQQLVAPISFSHYQPHPQQQQQQGFTSTQGQYQYPLSQSTFLPSPAPYQHFCMPADVHAASGMIPRHRLSPQQQANNDSHTIHQQSSTPYTQNVDVGAPPPNPCPPGPALLTHFAYRIPSDISATPSDQQHQHQQYFKANDAAPPSSLPQAQLNWHDTSPTSDTRLSPASGGAASLDRVWDEYQQAAFTHSSIHHGPGQLLTDAAIEAQDDDYFDVQSDEESEISFSALSHISGGSHASHYSNEPHQQLIRVLHGMSSLGSQRIAPPENMLDTYRPERVANPLRNEATARVFLHWITSTAPGLQAPFERDPRNTVSVFATRTVPLNQRGIWTYVMPLAALHDQGLLHAMLALSSIHIAHLQGGSLTPAFQHYAWSLKRVHKAVSNKKRKRLHITTIAASLLLAHYEMMTAEHAKWNTHLAGAKQLFLETDFAGMMQKFTSMKQEREMRRRLQSRAGSLPPTPGFDQDALLDQIPVIDESMIRRFYGKEVRYGQQPVGFVESRSMPAALDLSEFETLKDMYWWYCKQDVYLGLVGGNPLLMDWKHWSSCPPRAPIGKLDAVYGSFDHLVLILGRITTYSDKDRKRKLKVMKQQGGQWRPQPNSALARARPTPPSSSNSRTAKPASEPTFYGLHPSPPQRRMPSQYEPIKDNLQSSPADDEQVESIWSMEDALQEHSDISAALSEFQTRLGPDFAPLPLDPVRPYSTSFGPALLYKSYDVACVVALWNLAMILHLRSHPYCHPAAHAAAAMAASETAIYAQNIGRIAAGIPLPDADATDAPLDPFLGACLIEMTMPSMWAAVQYVDPAQRYETVARIYNVARRTGWRTADIIANGCETAWMLSAAAGRGPPYTRIIDSQIKTTLESHASGQPLDQTPAVHKSTASRLYRASGLLDTEDELYAVRAMTAVRSH